MVSLESARNELHYETIAGGDDLPKTPEQAIDYHETHWAGLTAEPREVDYIECEIGGMPALRILPKQADTARMIVHAHGGGFVSGSMFTHRKMLGHLGKAARCQVLVYDYPYAHQAKYPTQLDLAVAVYRDLLDQGVAPESMALSADSCGAMLALGTLQRAREEMLPFPATVMLLSAWLDMTLSSGGYEENGEHDRFFTRPRCGWLVANVLGGGNPRDPLMSPLFADLSGFPPIYMQVGGHETLLGENRDFLARALAAGVDARLDVFPQMLHSFQMMAGRAPEADEAIAQLGAWAWQRLSATSNGVVA